MRGDLGSFEKCAAMNRACQYGGLLDLWNQEPVDELMPVVRTFLGRNGEEMSYYDAGQRRRFHPCGTAPVCGGRPKAEVVPQLQLLLGNEMTFLMEGTLESKAR